jgi:peptidoglycan hydrolase CwlO-like protein
MKLTVIVSFLIIFASKAHAFLVVSPSARSMVVRRYAENAEDAEDAESPTGKPFVDPHKIQLERAKWEGTVSTKLEGLVKDVEEIKRDIREIKRDNREMQKEIGQIKIDMANGFGEMQKEIGKIKIDMANGFGQVKIDIGNVKATLNLGIAGLFFVEVLILLLVGGVKIGDAVRLANPL